MVTPSAESLIQALHGSGLYPADEAAALAAELAPLGSDSQVLMRYLVSRNRITVYQLRKIANGRAADLFVGPYVILDKLGEGGMGKVFRARHTRLGREVALKVVRPHLLDNPVVRGRYEREVQAALALSHPNIVSVYSAGTTDGRHYLEMEFVDGIDLTRLVQQYGVLPVPEACEYVRQAALGLHHAHELGFVHRDIKPSNILVSGERHVPEATIPARVRILDMGLVRSVGADDESGPDLTRLGAVVGTPDYMAPEQAKDSRGVDRRADLYSLGGTFYFVLTGQPPFPGGSPLDKVIRHLDHPPRPLQAARPDVPDELARIVARLMAKHPADRFGTAAELADALAPLARYGPDTVPTPAPAHATLADGRDPAPVPPGAKVVTPGGASPTPYSLVLTPAPVLERPALVVLAPDRPAGQGRASDPSERPLRSAGRRRKRPPHSPGRSDQKSQPPGASPNFPRPSIGLVTMVVALLFLTAAAAILFWW